MRLRLVILAVAIVATSSSCCPKPPDARGITVVLVENASGQTVRHLEFQLEDGTNNVVKNLEDGSAATFLTWPKMAQTFFSLDITLADGRKLDTNGSGFGLRYDLVIRAIDIDDLSD